MLSDLPIVIVYQSAEYITTINCPRVDRFYLAFWKALTNSLMGASAVVIA